MADKKVSGTVGNLNRAGRKSGVPNKSTIEFRQTVTKLLEDNAANVGVWLTQVASEDPAKALDLIAKLAEFAAPKLNRTEHVGESGGAIRHSLEVAFVGTHPA
jgi:hypothetical protein